jgi:hypothetical protein
MYLADHARLDSAAATGDRALFLADGRCIELRSIQCARNGCYRCGVGRGGYTFQYVGPWTCQNAFAENLQGRGPAGAILAWVQCSGCAACRSRRPF